MYNGISKIRIEKTSCTKNVGIEKKNKQGEIRIEKENVKI